MENQDNENEPQIPKSLHEILGNMKGWDAMKNDPYEKYAKDDGDENDNYTIPSDATDVLGKKKEHMIYDKRVYPELFGVERINITDKISIKVIYSKTPMTLKQKMNLERYHRYI